MFAAMESRPGTRTLVVALCVLALAGCGTMQKLWPFGKRAKPAPEAVHELNLVNADGSAASYPQYWSRNTLVIDLSGIAGAGTFAARLPEETTWPVRMALRLRPGSVQQLEILGEERNVLPVSPEGNRPIDIEIASSVYTPRTAAIYVSWGPMPVFAEGPPEPEQGFISPTVAPEAALPADGEAPPASASEIIPAGGQPPGI
jgi:hypothetical protein